jgi:DNA-directed RNA polymerase subunit M/transcription elongation factor TFIIS
MAGTTASTKKSPKKSPKASPKPEKKSPDKDPEPFYNSHANDQPFCPACGTLLNKITGSDSFFFRCDKCQEHSVPNAKDTLFYEDTAGTNLMVFAQLLRNAGQDPVNPKIRTSCRKSTCSSEMARQVRLADMSLVSICIKCGEKWLANA